jgi:superfamily II DNA or RNA helicase
LLHALDREVQGLYFPRGIWDAATNSGKTAAAASVIKNVIEPRAIILVDSVDLFRQHYAFFCTVFPDEVGRIHDKYYDIRKVTLCMAGTLFNRIKKSTAVAKDIYNGFNIVIADECHRTAAKQYSYVLQRINAGMRLFMSGTPLASDNDVKNMIIVGLSSNIIAKVTKKELMDKGVSLKAVVNFYHSKQEDLEYDDYDLEYTHGIVESKKRADQIAEICSERRNKKILINTVEIKHLVYIYEALISNKLLENFFIEYVHGQDAKREEKLAWFTAEGKNKIIISTSIMKLGLNIKDIDVLVYAQGGKAVIDLSQWSGRAERHDGVSEEMEIVDFWDNGKYISKHSNKRKNIWLNEKFIVNYKYENRRGKPIA